MIQRLRLPHILLTLIVFLSFTSAWPWPPTVEHIEGLIFRRQDKSKSDKESSGSTTQSNKSVVSSGKDSQTKDGTITSAASGKATQQTGSSKTTSKSSKSTPIDNRAPVGGIAMITPAPIAPAEYYKIGDNVEFVWNYTSLLATPRAIDVLVTCNGNKQTYTISNNATFEPTGRVVWDTSADETGPAPLLTESYTLVIQDADEDPTAVAKPGHLGSYNQFRFGMYLKQAYLPRDKWTCATCSGAFSDMQQQTLKFVFGMCTITVFSFTWFAGGFGVLF